MIRCEGSHMSAKSGLIWDFMVGGATAAAVGALGWLEVELATTPAAADTSIREFGTLITVIFGALAALWWNQSARLPDTSCAQSARLPDTSCDESSAASPSEGDANILNAAAASFTVLSLFCSVFASSPWKSSGSWLSAIGVLVVLASSGSDIRNAVPITLRRRPLVREILVLALIALGAAALLWHFGK
jgi:hypothetical protein